jgi:two-component system sensor histidine kinase BaeS
VRIQTKLFFIILSSCALLVTVMVLLMQWTVDRGLLKYVNIRQHQVHERIVGRLQQVYVQTGDWDFLRQNPGLLNRFARELVAGDAESDLPAGVAVDSRFAAGHQRPPLPGGATLVILDAAKQPVLGRYKPERRQYNLLPIRVIEGETPVGWLAFSPPRHLSEDFDLALAGELKKGVLSISFVSILLSAALAMLLAFLLQRRVKTLALATRKVAEGDYSARVDAVSGDELGQLGRDFNDLATTLQQNEAARKRWIADISHELRTPLSIAGGELEAMIDGVRPVSVANLQSARTEIVHLNRLVDDLYEMTNLDIGALQYRKSLLDFTALVRHETDSFSIQCSEHGLTCRTELPQKPLPIKADSHRMRQLLQNLLSNSIKYTDAPGSIIVRLGESKGQAVLAVEDSAPGVETGHLTRMFDHLFRVESSRNRKTGGAGLGLAICRQIVMGHNGGIIAAHSALGGVQMIVTLPLSEEHKCE